MTRKAVLPEGCLPRGLNREEAAAYVGVSASKFTQMVADHRMPAPKAIDARLVWDRHALDRAFAALPDVNGRAEGEDVEERWRCAV
jgi:predicted DNA-binding transcriptional regulator AlpA